MHRSTLLAITMPTLIAVTALSAWANDLQTVTFKKLTSGDAGDTSGGAGPSAVSDAAPSFNALVSDTVICSGTDGDHSGSEDCSRQNRGATGSDTIGAFGGRKNSLLLKLNPNGQNGDGVPVPAPGTVEHAELRLRIFNPLGQGVGHGWSVAALTSIDPDANFGDANQAYLPNDASIGITADNTFGPCSTENNCHAIDNRDYFSNDQNSVNFSMAVEMALRGISGSDIADDLGTYIDLDITGLYNAGAVTGAGVFVGRRFTQAGVGTGIFLSDWPDIDRRPEIVLEFMSAAIPGDANGDGMIDVGDLGIVGANFNKTDASVHDGDFNGDGAVDIADVGIVGANWSAAQGSGITANTAIPEPATISLLGLGLGYLGSRRRT
ncbi:MAG: hypothetical protein CMJ20_08155 [Phycisphaeraceae bacterium]|nr:hypothetical protein [Phycisphaeraceae bacterium]